MQKNTEKRIAELLNAYRRKRKWKVMTIILSAIVLFNTIYAMRDAAVAVTERNAYEAHLKQTVDAALRNSASTDIAKAMIRSDFIPDETGTPADGTEPPAEQPEAPAEQPETPVEQPAEETAPAEQPEVPAEETVPAEQPVTPAEEVIPPLVEPEITLPAEEVPVPETELPEEELLPEEEEEVLGEVREIVPVTLETTVGETRIVVSFMSDAFEETVTLDARQITEEDGEEYEEIAALVHEAAAEHETFTAEEFAVFDIYFLNEYGQQVEPLAGAAVDVSISTTGKETPDDVAEILHINKDNEVELMQAETNGYTAEFTTDSFSPYITVKTAPTGVAGNITSAYPTFLRVLDAQDNPVSEAKYNDMVAVELGWNIRNTYEVTNAGDYVEITLPDGLEFPSGNGNFKLDRAASVGSITYPAGTEIATFNVSGKTLRITYLEPAVRLITARKLLPAYTTNGVPWGELRFEGVRVTAQSPFRPQITINGQKAQHGYIINITNRQPTELSGVKLTRFLINGQTGTAYSPVEVSREDPFPVEIAWEWKSATQYIGKGDYYRIVLHESLACRDLDTTTMDERGNIIRIQLETEEVYISGFDMERQKRAVLTVTYLDVVSGYNESSGRITTTAYARVEDSDLNKSIDVWAKAYTMRSGSNQVLVTQTIKNYIRVKRGSSIPEGTWRLRASDLDVNVTYDFSAGLGALLSDHGSHTPHLFVVADHGGTLEDYPFENSGPLNVDFDPGQPYEGVPNYMDAYCISPFKDPPIGGVTTGSGKDFSKATQYDLISVDAAESIYGSITGEGKWNAGAASNLKRILSVSFPYVSTEEMLTELQARGGLRSDYTSISEREAVLAVQIAMWRVTYDGSAANDYYNYYKFRAGTSKVNNIAAALVRYQPPAGSTGSASVELDGEPLLSFDGNNVTISGKFNTDNLPEGAITGQFVSASGDSTDVQIDRAKGTFTATLENINPDDRFTVRFNGFVNDPGACRVLYFRNKATIIDIDSNPAQDLIAAVCGKKTVKIEWSSEGTRGIKVIKQFVDENGNAITPDAEIEVTIYRYVPGGTTREEWQVVKLNPANNYTWTAKGLPLKDKDGNYYRYDARETKVPEGWHLVESASDMEGTTFVFTFVNEKEEEEKTGINVSKRWDKLPEGYVKVNSRVSLYRTNANDTQRKQVYVKGPRKNGKVLTGEAFAFEPLAGYDAVIETLSDANEWTLRVEGLPQFEADGVTPIRYVFREEYFEVRVNNTLRRYYVNADGTTYYMENGQPKPGDFTVSVDQPDMSLPQPVATVINTNNVTKLKVIKYWEGVPDDLKQDMKAVVQLFRVNYFTNAAPTKTAVRSKDLKNVSEDTVNGLVLSGTYSARPGTNESDGEIVTATLTKNNHWSVTFENLPRYEEDGVTPIQYIVQEIEVYDAKGNEVSADFAIEYGPAMFRDRQGRLYAQPDMTAEEPLATVKNITEGSLRVIKQWIDADGREWTAVFPEEVIVELSAKLFGVDVPADKLKEYVHGEVRVSLTQADGWEYAWPDVVNFPGLKYFIKEVTRNPENNNYDLWDTVTGTAINQTNVPVEYNAEEKRFEVTLTNRRKPVEIELEKFDADDTTKLLPGAEFTLYRANDMKTPLGTYETGKDGRIKIPDLTQYVDYALLETKWPEGYVERDHPDPVIFRVEIYDGDNWIRIVKSPDYPAGSWVVDLNQRPLRLLLRISNQRTTYTLPEAGGEGTTGYMTGGMSIMIATLLMYITWQYMCNKGKRGASK
ncbi:MAG: Cna B-type domain-containing protein [Lachnospiraceae bacterium]|nr:Cna B-type domain-containing protein [Lachnospiraceae bacterium]